MSSDLYNISDGIIGKTYLTSGTTTVGNAFDYYSGKIYTITVYGDDHVYTIDASWMDTSEYAVV